MKANCMDMEFKHLMYNIHVVDVIDIISWTRYYIICCCGKNPLK